MSHTRLLKKTKQKLCSSNDSRVFVIFFSNTCVNVTFRSLFTDSWVTTHGVRRRGGGGGLLSAFFLAFNLTIF